jgi:hypothetical protein
VVVFALAAQLRRCGLPGRLPHGLLDELVAPWGLKRQAGTLFLVPCDCGRLVRRLLLTRSGWACGRCDVTLTRLEMQAGRLLFGFRLGLRGRFLTNLHRRVVRLLLGTLPRGLWGGRRFQVVQAATVVVSFEPRTKEPPWRPLGPVGRELAGQVLDVWLREWASPVVYAARCRAEIGVSPIA